MGEGLPRSGNVLDPPLSKYCMYAGHSKRSESGFGKVQAPQHQDIPGSPSASGDQLTVETKPPSLPSILRHNLISNSSSISHCSHSARSSPFAFAPSQAHPYSPLRASKSHTPPRRRSPGNPNCTCQTPVSKIKVTTNFKRQTTAPPPFH